MTNKKTGPFEAVIDTLVFCLFSGDLRKHTEKMMRWSKTAREKQAREAIRVLEAAGKVDKTKLLAYLNHEIAWKENDPYGPGSAERDRELRAFIESLPDEEKA